MPAHTNIFKKNTHKLMTKKKNKNKTEKKKERANEVMNSTN